MGDKPLRLTCRRGTAVIGAVAIIATFTIAVAAMSIMMMEYARYASHVKSINEKTAMKAKESLEVNVTNSGGATWITVKNNGPSSALIVGVYAVNTTSGTLKYYKLTTPVGVGVLKEKTFQAPEYVPEQLKVGVLTSMGNIFWEKGS